jgi:hypothetical protein
MSAELNLTIKNYHNRGGDLRMKITSAITSEKTVGSIRVIKLIITRKPDQHSSRLGMFAYLRNNRSGYQSLGFAEITLTFDRYSDNGKFLSRTVVVFFDVGVESVAGEGDEEKITFIAGRKSNEFRIP